MAVRHAAVRSVGIIIMPQKEKGGREWRRGEERVGRRDEVDRPYIINNNVAWFADRGIDIIEIPYNTKSPEKYMKRIHGLYLQGGPVYNEDYMKTASRLLDLAVEANRDGEYFPVWGTCHGFQTLIMKFGGLSLDGDDLGYFDARRNYMGNVHVTLAGLHSRMAAAWPKWFKSYLEKGENVYFANRRGISPEEFLKNKALRNMFSMVGTSHDRDGKRFVSIIEAKKGGLPFYGTQFHPEAVPTLEPFRSFFVDEILKNHKKKQRGFAKTFRERRMRRYCTRAKRGLNHNRFQDGECYFF